MKDQVRRMAENDEPKCGNCKHWDALNSIAANRASGKCKMQNGDLTPGYEALFHLVTLDLSLCSAWEQKE